ncbi:MAG: tripartite tricarboxylate transporter substrate binding protein [Betaproteobacteria bacterium]|jgi:hypothetical protein
MNWHLCIPSASISAALLISVPVYSQQRLVGDYPNKAVRLIVPFVAGGPMDVIGRLVGQKFFAETGQNFIIDNRAGASSIIGSDAVAKAAPDGYTMLHTSSAHAMLSSFNKLPYDPVRDFAAITPGARTVGYLLSVHPSLPVKSLADLLALAKKTPGGLNHGTSGYGGVLHVGMELFNAAAGIKMTAVQYKGVSQVVTDLAGGHIDLALLTSSNAVAITKTGKVRTLAITGSKRWGQMPDVPTVDEGGLKGFTYYAWYGFWFPAGTSPELVGRMHDVIAKADADPVVITRLEESGFEPYILSPADFTKIVQKEIESTKRIAQRLGEKI